MDFLKFFAKTMVYILGGLLLAFLIIGAWTFMFLSIMNLWGFYAAVFITLGLFMALFLFWVIYALYALGARYDDE
jgi:hypothetical protein